MTPLPLDSTPNPGDPRPGSRNPELDALLVKFDAKEEEWKALARASSVLAQVEAGVHAFLESVWPEIKPVVMAGVDLLSVAAGAATGPLGPLVAFVVKSFGTAGLNYLVAWLARKTAPSA